MVTETDLTLGDGRTLHVYDTGPADALGLGSFPVMGHSGGGPP